MKKSLILIPVGVLLIGCGIFLYFMGGGLSGGNGSDRVLSRDDAIGVVNGLLKNVIKVYENPSSIFAGVESGETTYNVDVENYEKVVKGIFSEKGIKQLENTSFSDKKFVEKNDGKVSLLKDIPSTSSYKNSSINFDQVAVYAKKINCVVTFSSYEIDSDDVLNYYVITKNVTVIKDEDNWLIDDFDYVNK